MNEDELSRTKMVDLLNSAKRLRADVWQDAPVEGSSAATELEDRVHFADSQPVTRVITVADYLSLVCVELLHGLAVLVEDGEGLFSAFPLVRSVIEHSTMIIWVLDPECTTVERAARAALLVERSQSESTKVAKRMGTLDSDEIYLTEKNKRTKLRGDIDREFGCSIASTNEVSGQHLPSPTEIVKHFGDRWSDGRQWVGTYDFLCGTFTHPSLNITGFITTDEEKIKVGLPLQLSISVELSSRLLQVALVPFVISIEHFSYYAGCNHKPIHEYMEKLNKVLGQTFR